MTAVMCISTQGDKSIRIVRSHVSFTIPDFIFAFQNTMHLNINDCRIELIRGDITDQEVDTIVKNQNFHHVTVR